MKFHVVHVPVLKPITSVYLDSISAPALSRLINAKYIEAIALHPKIYAENSFGAPIMLVDEEAKLSREPKEFNLMASFMHTTNLTTAPLLGDAVIVWSADGEFHAVPGKYTAGFWRKKLQDLL